MRPKPQFLPGNAVRLDHQPSLRINVLETDDVIGCDGHKNL